MFDQFNNTQSFADAVKQIMQKTTGPQHQRLAALETVIVFERFDWQPEKMQQVADWLNVRGFRLDGDSWVYDLPENAPTQTALVMDVLLNRYIAAMQGLDGPEYTEKEAAVFLCVCVKAIKAWCEENTLTGIQRDNARVFTREILEAFVSPEKVACQ